MEPHDFANVEDMLFEVFRCEETDTIDSILSKYLRGHSLKRIFRLVLVSVHELRELRQER